MVRPLKLVTLERDCSFCFSGGPSSEYFDTLFRNEFRHECCKNKMLNNKRTSLNEKTKGSRPTLMGMSDKPLTNVLSRENSVEWKLINFYFLVTFIALSYSLSFLNEVTYICICLVSKYRPLKYISEYGSLTRVIFMNRISLSKQIASQWDSNYVHAT